MNQFALGRGGLQLQQKQAALGAANQYAALLGTVDPLAARAFQEMGGGNIWNSMMQGNTALSDAANLPAARTMRTASEPLELPGWQGGGGAYPASPGNMTAGAAPVPDWVMAALGTGATGGTPPASGSPAPNPLPGTYVPGSGGETSAAVQPGTSTGGLPQGGLGYGVSVYGNIEEAVGAPVGSDAFTYGLASLRGVYPELTPPMAMAPAGATMGPGGIGANVLGNYFPNMTVQPPAPLPPLPNETTLPEIARMAHGGLMRSPMAIVGDAPMGMGPAAGGARPEILVDPTMDSRVIPFPMARQMAMQMGGLRRAANGIFGSDVSGFLQPEDQPYLDQVRRLRTSLPAPTTNPFDVKWRLRSPTTQQLDLRTQQYRIGVSPEDQLQEIQRYYLPGLQRGGLRLGV